MDDYSAGKSEYSVKLKTLIDEFKLETLYIPEGRKIKITQPEVNRPGLALSGFFEFFDPNRIQLFGNAEHQYIASLSKKERLYRLEQFAVHHPPVIILTTSLSVFDEIDYVARKYGIAILRTAETTSAFQASLIASLNIHLAPRITRHGVFVEVYGEGVLIFGESGVGKSEAAIELVKRGHRLVADDAVEIKRVSSKTLVGTAPEIIRHYVELRGIGIVDVRRIFGMGSVKMSEKVDLIIKLEPWDKAKIYDRIGLDNETTNILGLNIPTLTIPVRPGRNLAIILEIAAMNNRQRKMGYNTAEEFNKRMMEQMFAPKNEDDD
ncbi:MAG: HPr(Ser) kinase/phosphatase [Clostridia bacterium]|nr:HPr(Ser) kinase/phosphatase [Clostridia bacterium]